MDPGSLWSQDAEVDEGTPQGDVKVDREEGALHKPKGMPRQAPEKQEAWETQGHKHLLGHFPMPHPFRAHPKQQAGGSLPEAKVTHICMPQAPDKTSKWTTLIRLPGSSPFSILCPWGGGSSNSA